MAVFCEMMSPGSRLSDDWPSVTAILSVPPFLGDPPAEGPLWRDLELLQPANSSAPRLTPPAPRIWRRDRFVPETRLPNCSTSVDRCAMKTPSGCSVDGSLRDANDAT